MSDRDLNVYLTDILESIKGIEEYTEKSTYEEFSNDRKTYSATIREFEIIGEALSKIPDKIKEKYEDVPWRDIKDFRNLLIHEYFGVDLEMVWDIVENELPLLKKQILCISKNLDITKDQR